MPNKDTSSLVKADADASVALEVNPESASSRTSHINSVGPIRHPRRPNHESKDFWAITPPLAKAEPRPIRMNMLPPELPVMASRGGAKRPVPVTAVKPWLSFKPPVFGVPAAPADKLDEAPNISSSMSSGASKEWIIQQGFTERGELCKLIKELKTLCREDVTVSQGLHDSALEFMHHLDSVLSYLNEISRKPGNEQDIIDYGREVLKDIKAMCERVRTVVYPSGTAISRRCERWREQMLKCARAFDCIQSPGVDDKDQTTAAAVHAANHIDHSEASNTAEHTAVQVDKQSSNLDRQPENDRFSQHCEAVGNTSDAVDDDWESLHGQG